MALRLLACASRSRCLILAKSFSIGLRSGEYCGRKNSRAPALRMAVRIAPALGEPRSPGRDDGYPSPPGQIRTCGTTAYGSYRML